MKKLKKWYVHGLCLATISCALYAQLFLFSSTFFGFCIFLLYIGYVGNFATYVLVHIFGYKVTSGITRVLAYFFVFLCLGFATAIGVVWYKITPLYLWIVFVTIALLFFTSATILRKKRRFLPKNTIYKKNFSWMTCFTFSPFPLVSYIVLCVTGLVLLFVSNTGRALFSPWEAIHHMFLPVVFLLFVLMGFCLFSKIKTSLVLIIIVAHSLLLHSYLPVTHELPWGGDVWRLVAVEQQLADGNSILPVLFGPEVQYKELFGLQIPEALLIPHKYIYGHLHGTIILLEKTLQISLLSIHKWLVPLLWSVMVPLLLYKIGFRLFSHPKMGLLLAMASTIPFIFQANGGLTLGVSFGFITFLFVLLCWFEYIKNASKKQRNLVILLSVLMIFGYTLYTIVMWVIIVATILFTQIKKKKDVLWRTGMCTGMLFSGLFILPLIELMSKSSTVAIHIYIIEKFRIALGQFSGWYFANSIPLHNILPGNILFNQTPQSIFFSTPFLLWRWHLVLCVSVIVVLLIAAFWYFLHKKYTVHFLVSTFLAFMVVGGYGIGWYVLEGDRSFVRRLDALFALSVLLLCAYGFFAVMQYLRFYRYSLRSVRVFSVVCVLFFSWVGTTTYASGPDIRVLSTNEYNAATYVWENYHFDSGHACVLADTWLLLALEAHSSGSIVGGGFPITAQFGQFERTRLFAQVTELPSHTIMQHALRITEASYCVVILPKQEQNSAYNTALSEIFRGQEAEFAPFSIYSYRLKK